MNKHLSFVLVIAVLTAAVAAAQTSRPAAGQTTSHSDLSGTWLFSIDLPPLAIKRQVNGAVTVKGIDASGRRPAAAVPGALPSTPEPSYKPELRAKVKDLFDHESRTDNVFYCGKPGVPRIGSPRRIIQLSNEMVFLYEDISGDPYRIIPTDGRAHKKDPNPSYYGDSVGRWEGNVLVVDAVGFVEDTWFGEGGYFHSDQMRVVETFRREGNTLRYQATVYDPEVLVEPWVMAPRTMRLSPGSDGILPERGNCEVYELEDITSQIRH